MLNEKTRRTNPVSSLMRVLSENEFSVGRVDGQRQVSEITKFDKAANTCSCPWKSQFDMFVRTNIMHYSTLVSYSTSDIRHAILYAHGHRLYYERK